MKRMGILTLAVISMSSILSGDGWAEDLEIPPSPISICWKDHPDSSRTVYLFPEIEVEPGSVYSASFNYRDQLLDGSGMYMVPIYYDKEGKKMNLDIRDQLPVFRGCSTNVWTRFTGRWLAPSNSRKLSASLIVPAGYPFSADLGNFRIEKLTGTEGKNWAAALRRRGAISFPPNKHIRMIADSLDKAPVVPGARPSDRKRWDELARTPEGIAKIAECIKVLNKPMPFVSNEDYLEYYRIGRRFKYEDPFHARLHFFEELVVGECLENKGRFVPRICEYLQAMCNERSWVVPAHDHGMRNFKGIQITIDLGSVFRGGSLATALRLLGDKIPEHLQKRTRYELFKRILLPYRQSIHNAQWGRIWWAKSGTNWNPVCHSGIIECALALIEDPMIRAEYIACAEWLSGFYFKGFYADGYCVEGMGYWNYGFGSHIQMSLAILAATHGKIDLLKSNIARKVAEYSRHFQAQRGCAPWFADSGGTADPKILALLRQRWDDIVPLDIKFPDFFVGSHFGGGLRNVCLRGFGQEPPIPKNPPKDILPLRSWFPFAQILLCRPAGDDSRPPLSIGLKGGHNNDSHNHNDLGSYSIFLDGAEMMGDPGGELYTSRTFSTRRYDSKVLNSFGHPVPVVDGMLQPPGGSIRSRIIETRFTDDEDRLVMDLTRAYPMKKLSKLIRTFVYNRVNQTITVSDKVTFSEPGTFSVAMLTCSEIKPWSEKGKYTLAQRGRELDFEFQVNGGNWKIEREKIPNPQRRSPVRLAATIEKPVTEAEITILYRVRKSVKEEAK